MLRSHSDFDAFWAAYPSKVGKLAAQEEYVKARKRASAEDILKGVEAYKVHKPTWKEWCNPKTFLHQGRWMDEYDVPVVKVATDFDWYRDCALLHGGACGGDRMRHHIRVQTEQAKAAAS